MPIQTNHLSEKRPKRRDKSLVVRGVAFHRYQWTWLKRKAKTLKMGNAVFLRVLLDSSIRADEAMAETKAHFKKAAADAQ